MRASNLSHSIPPNAPTYENFVPRNVHSEDIFNWALGALTVDEFAAHMSALYALTGCRMPEHVCESGTDVYIGYCDAAGEPQHWRDARATHVGWTAVFPDTIGA